MVVKFLATAVVTGLLLSVTVGPQKAAAQQAVAQQGALVNDSSFIQTAASIGLLQEKLGKLAEKKASSPSVKEFGKKMQADYSKANQELASGAKQAAYPAPIILRQHKLILDRFIGMGKGSFDKNYMAEVVKQHDEQVRLFQQESESGKVASLKQMATKMLPEVQQRQSLAMQTAATVGAGVRASTSAERATSN
jgi:putative membrane protein